MANIRPYGYLNPQLLGFYDPLEAVFQRDLYVTATKLFGWKVYATRDPRHSPAGEADLRCYRPPRALHLELKRNHVRDSEIPPAQIEYADLVRACGLEYHLVRPRDWNRLMEILT